MARSDHPLYGRWKKMRARCLYPTAHEYERYGGRGITVCDRWNDFGAFAQDVGMPPTPQHTLDRIDNDGHYEPSNVRWATLVEQQRNKRNTRLLTANGKTMCLAAWIAESGVSGKTITARLAAGMSESDAINTPKKINVPRGRSAQASYAYEVRPNRFAARIYESGRGVHLGMFPTREQAQQAAQAYLKEQA